MFHVRFWTTKPPDFGPNRNKTGVSSVSAVPSVPHQRGPLTKREARLTKRACERLTKCEARLTHKKGASGFQVQDTHNASYFTNMTWIGLNLSGWNVTRLFHLRCFELWLRVSGFVAWNEQKSRAAGSREPLAFSRRGKRKLWIMNYELWIMNCELIIKW